MILRYAPLFTLLTLGLAVTACGDHKQLSEEDALSLWGSLEGNLDGNRRTARGADVDINFTTHCPQAGSMDFDGTFARDHSDDDGFEVVSTFDYDIEFDGCSKHDRTLDGDVAWSSGFEASKDDEGAAASYTYHWQGDLVVSGDIEGDCTFDVTGRVEATASSVGGTFNASVEKEYEGTLCGHDARRLLASDQT